MFFAPHRAFSFPLFPIQMMWHIQAIMMETAPQTRSDWVCERLNQAIVIGELSPRARLMTAELAQRWALCYCVKPSSGWQAWD